MISGDALFLLSLPVRSFSIALPRRITMVASLRPVSKPCFPQGFFKGSFIDVRFSSLPVSHSGWEVFHRRFSQQFCQRSFGFPPYSPAKGEEAFIN